MARDVERPDQDTDGDQVGADVRQGEWQLLQRLLHVNSLDRWIRQSENCSSRTRNIHDKTIGHQAACMRTCLADCETLPRHYEVHAGNGTICTSPTAAVGNRCIAR